MDAKQLEGLISSYKNKEEELLSKKSQIEAKCNLYMDQIKELDAELQELGFNSIDEAKQFVIKGVQTIQERSKEIDDLLQQLNSLNSQVETSIQQKQKEFLTFDIPAPQPIKGQPVFENEQHVSSEKTPTPPQATTDFSEYFSL